MKTSWPTVAIVALGAGFVVAVLWLIPSDMPEARSALLGVITASIGTLVTVAVQSLSHQIERTRDKVDTIARQTNGHLTTLINAKTQPDVSRETSGPSGTPVSRETSEEDR